MPRGSYEDNPAPPRFESTQVKLKLTENEEILEAMETYKRFRYDKQKKSKYAVLQFDGREFRFYPGKTITVGKLVANALRRDSAIITDPDNQLTGDILPFVEVVSEYNILEGDPTESLPPTACPICHEDQKTYPRLARHLMKAHPEHSDEEVHEAFEQQEGNKEAEAHFDASDGELEKE